MYNFTESELKNLNSCLKDDTPLGPIDGASIKNPDVAKILFEQDNQIYRNITRRPSIVIGRRGSGKTSFLEHLKNHEYAGHVVVDVKLSGAIINIRNFVSLSSTQDLLPPEESVAELWDWLFWTALYLQVKKQRPATFKRVKKDYSVGKKFESWFANFQYSTLGNLANFFSSPNRKSNTLETVSGAVLNSLPGFTSDRLNVLKRLVKICLKNSRSKAIILVDSLDQYEVENKVNDRVLSGLIKSAGRFNSDLGRPEMRLCLPSELYFYFVEISSNSLKDFANDIKLHWHPRELLSLAAGRYLTFLYCNRDRVDEKKLQALFEIRSEEGRNWGLRFWEEILPDKIVNRYGVEENSVAYIIRHTHLLPRQLIMFLNKIISLSIRANDSLLSVDANLLTAALTRSESNVWGEVCNAYKASYPDARKICIQAIPHLPLIFNVGELQKVYTENVKPISSTFSDDDMDVYKFERMLIEIGCIGLVQPNSSSDRYVEGLFEYNSLGQIMSNTDSVYCLHPMFCSVRTQPKKNLTTKVIMPKGNEPDSADYRSF